MRYLIVPQKYHGGEIQTVSLSKSNDLVATGGKDNTISIWKAEDLTRLIRADPTSLPELTPQHSLAIHKSTVKLIRWNPSNEMVFISASDDGVLILSNLELQTHKNICPWLDTSPETASLILDGCWSPDGRLFSWSTLNGKVHIYDTKKETHQDLVSGEPESGDKKITVQQSITFGPTFNCLVCMGDDMLVSIFEYEYDQQDFYHFKMKKRISKFIGNSAVDTTSISHKRITWSCDGEFVAVPNAANQSSSLITLLSSSHDWTTKLSLFGHDTLCNSVIFGPKILQSANPVLTTGAPPFIPDLYHIIATTGSDNTLVLWNTSKELPIAIIKNTSSRPISEMSWFNSGQALIMVSLDGHIILVSFDQYELGMVAPQKIYDDIIASQKILIQAQGSKDVNGKDSPAQKKLKTMNHVVDQADAKSIHSMQRKVDKVEAVMKAPEAIPAIKKPKQSTLEADVGHITPEIPTSEPVKVASVAIASSNKTDSNSRVAESNSTKLTKKSSLSKVNQADNISVQKVSSKDGKKRIQPILLSNKPEISSLPSQVKVSNGLVKDNSDAKVLMEFDKPSLLVSDDQFDAKKTKKPTENAVGKKVKRDLEPVRYIGTVVTNPSTSFARVRLSTPRVRHEFRISDSASILDIKNGQGNESAPTRISNFKNEVQIWTDFIPKYVHLAVKGDGFWALSTSEGQIITYSHTSGKRLLPPMVLGSPVSFLECKGKYLMAVTSIAEVYVWDLEHRKSHIKTTSSLAALLDLNMKFKDETLSKSDSITMCSITSQGLPLITLSNGSGYVYNCDMEVWQTVTETWWAFGSHYWDSIGDENLAADSRSTDSARDKGSSLITLLEHRTNEELLRKSRSGRGKYFSKLSKNMIMKEGFENLENTISLSHLENRILCSEILGEQADFRDFLNVYAKRLCELGLKAKLFEICELILGDNLEGSKSHDTICGLDRKVLLKEMIVACAEYRDAQRILVHFGQKIGLIDLEYS